MIMNKEEKSTLIQKILDSGKGINAVRDDIGKKVVEKKQEILISLLRA